jgi:hypothetical protein
VWCYTSVNPVLGRMRQEDPAFEASETLSLKKKKIAGQWLWKLGDKIIQKEMISVKERWKGWGIKKTTYLKTCRFWKYFFSFFWWDWVLNSELHVCKAGTLLLEPVLQPIFSGHFGDGVLQTICLGWPQTMILPISARITGMSHPHPVRIKNFDVPT